MRPLRPYSYSNHKEKNLPDVTVITRKIKKKAELLHAIFVIPFAKLGEKRTLGECTCVVKVDMPWSRFFFTRFYFGYTSHSSGFSFSFEKVEHRVYLTVIIMVLVLIFFLLNKLKSSFAPPR